MCQHVLRYAPLLLLLATVSAAGCEQTSDSPTAPELRGLQPASITAEPVSARPEFLPSLNCSGLPAFGVVVVINPRRPNVVLTGLEFVFVDLFGVRTIPDILPFSSRSSTAGSIPTASAVPLPGIAALPPLPLSEPMTFLARFGCGVRPEGTLSIFANENGTQTQMKVMVKQ